MLPFLEMECATEPACTSNCIPETPGDPEAVNWGPRVSPMPLTTVYIPGPRGQYATNVDASSSGEAVRKAVAFFLDPFWKGPKPKAGTVLRVCPMGGKEIRARVPAEIVICFER